MTTERIEVFRLLKNKIDIVGGIPKDLRCVKCKEVTVNALSLNCGCLICSDCMDLHRNYIALEEQNTNANFPFFNQNNINNNPTSNGDELNANKPSQNTKFCSGASFRCGKVPIHEDKYVSSCNISNNRVETLICKCVYQNCGVLTEMVKMVDHIKVCEHQDIECPYKNIGCNIKGITKRNFNEHLEKYVKIHSNLVNSAPSGFNNDDTVRLVQPNGTSEKPQIYPNHEKIQIDQELRQKIVHPIFSLPAITYNHVQQMKINDLKSILRSFGLLTSTYFCFCGGQCLETKFPRSIDDYIWRCRKCFKTYSIRKNSIFEESNLKLQTIWELMFRWCLDESPQKTSEEMDISKNTVIFWIKKFRAVCAAKLNQTKSKIGGPNTVVALDEIMFMHRKYHRRIHYNDQWCLGGIEIQNPNKCFIVKYPDNKRGADVLIPRILENIELGSVIVTDKWNIYDSMMSQEYHHLTSNYNLNFISSENETFVNNVRNLWSEAKNGYRNMRGTTPGLFESYLTEFMWKKQYADRKFEHFLSDISDVYILS